MSKTDSRSTTQNNAYWLFQQMIADEMSYQDKNINNLLEVILVAPTKNNLHEVFKAILWAKYQKDSTKGMTREEMQDCLDDYMNALELAWVHIEFPSNEKRNLLQYF